MTRFPHSNEQEGREGTEKRKGFGRNLNRFANGSVAEPNENSVALCCLRVLLFKMPLFAEPHRVD